MIFNTYTIISLLIAAGGAEATYSYDDTTNIGPSNWANLNIAGNECGGSKNSGIALSASGCEAFDAAYEFDGGSCSLDDIEFKTVDNGVKAFFPPSSTCRANRMKIPNVDGIYQAAQYHVHIDTEHKFEGNDYDFELHIVHARVSGSGSSVFPDGVGGTNQFAVYGYAIEAGGATNPEFQQLLDKWVDAQNAAVSSCSSPGGRALQEQADDKSYSSLNNNNSNLRKTVTAFDIYSLVDDRDFFHYGGGLTTPPCTEAVWFNMARAPIIISDAQASTLRNVILDFRDNNCQLATKADPATGTTARPIQPVNNRDVQLICNEDDSLLASDLYLSVGPVDVDLDALELVVDLDVGGLGIGGLLP